MTDSPRYRAVYHFTAKGSSDSLEVEVDADVYDTDLLRDRAHEKAADLLGYETPEAMLSKWEPNHPVTIGYANPPWSDRHDLQNQLLGVPGVEDAEYIGPYDGGYSPPQYVLDVDASEGGVVDRLTEVYGGLNPERENGSVVVYPSPTPEEKVDG